ncbi:MAG: PqqD family protein [Deltaproteobacteria bacterium]|nr:MAG: PqqD family protein [Deltaproteobacteria bacterium]
MDLTAAVRAPEGVLVRELGGESVLLDLESESYFGLDDVGTRMWAAMTRHTSLREAFDELLAHYDVPAETLERDLIALTEELIEHGLLALDKA